MEYIPIIHFTDIVLGHPKKEKKTFKSCFFYSNYIWKNLKQQLSGYHIIDLNQEIVVVFQCTAY